MADTIGIYVSGVLLLAVFSYLIKDNKAYTYAEHLYVGFAAAQAVILGWQNVRDIAFLPLIKGKLVMLAPLVLGLLLYSRFFKSLSHLARLPMAFMMGAAAGVTVVGVVEAQFIAQVKATMLPLTSLNNIVLVVGTVTTIAFFLFIPLKGKEQAAKSRNNYSGILDTVRNLGRATIMVAFGASYGFTVMSRMSYLVARLEFLFGSVIPIFSR